MTNPQGLAFDAAGNLYVAYFVGDIVEYSPTGTVLNTFATALAGPVGVAFDTAGNLYVANLAGNNVVELSPTGGFIQNFAAVTSPLGLAFDAFGNLYVSDLNGQILKFSPVGDPPRRLRLRAERTLFARLWPGLEHPAPLRNPPRCRRLRYRHLQ